MQGKWFEAFEKGEARQKAIDFAVPRGFTVWEVQFVAPLHSRYYAGVQMPKKIMADLARGKLHVLRVHYPTKGAP